MKGSAEKKSMAPYVALTFNLCLALLLFWLSLSDPAWSLLQRAAPELVVLNGIMAVLFARMSIPKRALSIASKYGVEVTEKEKKLIEEESPRIARLFSILFTIASLAYVLYIYLLEISAPWLFFNALVGLIVILLSFFMLTIIFVVVPAYYYSRAHPELRSLNERVRERARQVRSKPSNIRQ